MNALADPTPRAPDLPGRVRQLAAAIEEEEARQRAHIQAALPGHRQSATNLAHYIGLRRQDIRRLQLELSALALSSLGRCEGHVRDTLRRLMRWLEPESAAGAADEPLDWGRAEAILHENTKALFGPRPQDRHVYIMVTAPEAAEATPEWADALLRAGADVLRVNAAHGTPEEWEAIVATFRARAQALGRSAKVFVDLPGPKLRADIVQTQQGVLHLRRRKNRQGRTVGPTVVDLVGRYAGGAALAVPRAWLGRMRRGDRIGLTDAGGRRRTLVVHEADEGCVRAECDQSLYLTSGLELEWRRRRKRLGRGVSGPMPRQPRDLRFAKDALFLLNASGRCDDPRVPVLACPEPGLLANVAKGERVVLDDGRIVAVVVEVRKNGHWCRVLQTVKTPARLRTGKGLAFPDSRIAPGTLGPQDASALAFALAHADGIGVSFVNSAKDVALVTERLRAAGRPGFGMILKLETRESMRNLAGILFEALKYAPVGLMIARGDLAVEISFERLAEMQEEILWFGEACHLPVIWATQVLDTLAHSGIPTRAEVTDAAMAMRAECVMLNKGPFAAAAVRSLVDIIRKMEAHQYKKRSLYRPLSIALGTR